MVHEVQYQDFIADKHGFFATVRTLDQARARVTAHGYDFYANNEDLIRKEFDLLFESLRKDDNNREAFWLYCYYCCLMLQLFHEGHTDTDKAEEYLVLREKIRDRCELGKFPDDPMPEKYFIFYLWKKIREGLIEILRTLTSLTKIKNNISLANMSRIYWFFCRTTITKTFLFARDVKLLDQISKIFGTNIDVDKIVKFLEKPKPVTNFLSVAFLVTRFILNAGLLLKHTLFPSEEEKDLNMKQRFCNEMYKRHAEFLNDIVWSLVNLVTNYNTVFHISEATAGWMLAGFLAFDFMLIIWQLHLAEKEYLIKVSQLNCDLQYYQDRLRREYLDPEERRTTEEHCRLLIEEIQQLNISWQAKRAAFIFVAVAAFTLMAGFSASMLFSGPVIVIACYAVCTFAMAMYLSNDSFCNFREKQLKLQQAKIENKNIEQATAAYNKALYDFIFTLIQNAVIPTLVITTLTLYWPAAVVLAAAFIGYKMCWGAYQDYTEKQSEAMKQRQNENAGVDEEIEEHHEENENQGYLIPVNA